MNGSILLVEDNEQILKGNRRMLKRSGYETMIARNLGEARERIKEAAPDAIVLDIMLPDGSGLDFMRELRQYSNIPILLLTGLKTPEDKVRGLREGGDDYLIKPYDFDELLARVEALLRRAGRVPDVLQKGALKLNIISGQAFHGKEDLLLAKKEFALLLQFAQNERKTISAECLYEKAWEQPLAGNRNALQAAISKLRLKIEPYGYEILMEREHGYTFTKI